MITETECVYCAVRTESWNAIRIHFIVWIVNFFFLWCAESVVSRMWGPTNRWAGFRKGIWQWLMPGCIGHCALSTVCVIRKALALFPSGRNWLCLYCQIFIVIYFKSSGHRGSHFITCYLMWKVITNDFNIKRLQIFAHVAKELRRMCSVIAVRQHKILFVQSFRKSYILLRKYVEYKMFV
jgi:hypothetical protein